MLLDALQHSSILVQAFCDNGSVSDPDPTSVATLPFPLSKEGSSKLETRLLKHPAMETLKTSIDVEHTCGFITLVNLDLDIFPGGCNDAVNGGFEPDCADLLKEEVDSIEDEKPKLSLNLKGDTKPENWVLLDVNFGIPLFNAELNKEVCNKIVSCGLWKNER